MSFTTALDPADSRRALHAPRELEEWNAIGVLTAADIHVATTLLRLGGRSNAGVTDNELVLLGAAFAVRAVRLSSVCVDLATISGTAASESDPTEDLATLPWPSTEEWLTALGRSRLVGEGNDDRALPLRLAGSRLYLDRYWRQERQVASDLAERAAHPVESIDLDLLRQGLDRMFPLSGEVGDADLPRVAAAAAVACQLAVIAGGPGTGKTTAVAKILALLEEQAQATGPAPLRVALAAPTGKAAARLAEAVHDEARRLDISEQVRSNLLDLEASTLHRLLGWRPDSQSRFRHDRGHKLPHDTIIVDETSMLSLSLMAKLVEAVRTGARLILLGDPQQLASVEAGAVLGDIVGPAAWGMRICPPARQRLESMAGVKLPEDRDSRFSPGTHPPRTHVGDGIVVLRRVHRFSGGIAELARAVGTGDSAEAVRLLRSGAEDLRWSDAPGIRADVVVAGSALVEAARERRDVAALEALGKLRVLCAHRQGPYGVGEWNQRIERWLSSAIPAYRLAGPWYPGRPLLITANDYELQLFNGDAGVVIGRPGEHPSALFERKGQLWEVSPMRLRSVETVHAMTIHKAQGSQFDEVVVALPEVDGPIITRELLYTAVTRARRRVTLVGPEEVFCAAVERPISRASGLREHLWSD